jgi:putative transposase
MWSRDYEDWSKRGLSESEYVYLWADGIHVNVRLEDDANRRQCILVPTGATPDGRKELIVIHDGYRQSEQSWSELLLELNHHGLSMTPRVTVTDGALGFWAAALKVFPEMREQRCRVHKTDNVLNKLPKSVQPKAKSDIHDIWQAETRNAAGVTFDHFLEK